MDKADKALKWLQEGGHVETLYFNAEPLDTYMTLRGESDEPRVCGFNGEEGFSCSCPGFVTNRVLCSHLLFLIKSLLTMKAVEEAGVVMLMDEKMLADYVAVKKYMEAKENE